MCEKTQMEPTSAQLEHAIRRNFGGSEQVKTYEIFKRKIPSLGASWQAEDIAEEVRRDKVRKREKN